MRNALRVTPHLHSAPPRGAEWPARRLTGARRGRDPWRNLKHAHPFLSLSLLASMVAAACSATNPATSTSTSVGGAGGVSGTSSSAGTGAVQTTTSSSGSHSSSAAGTGGATTTTTTSSSSGATSTTTGSSSSSTGTGPIGFDGGWQIPDAGTDPPLVGDGGTTVEIGPGADATSPGKFGGGGAGAGLSLVYPPSGVILPPNTNTIEFHFIPAAGQTLFQLTFHAPSTNLVVYTGCTPVGAGCVYTPDATFWSSLAAYARGTQPVTYTVKGVNGASPGAVGTSATATIAFDQQDMTGGIYYWDTSGVIQRYDYGFPNAPPQQYLTPATAGALFCVGCHVLSRQGDKIAAGQFIPSPATYKIYDVATKAPLTVGGTALGGSANFMSFSPDGKLLLTSDGVSINWLDLPNDQTLATPIVASGTMPDWAPDGLHMVYAQPSSPSFFAVPGVDSASIVSLHFNGVGWDTPTTVVPFAGQNNYYPAIAPSGQWIVFNRSPSNAESFSNAAPDPDAGTVPDGELWTVAMAGGTPVRLSSASNPGALSWPKWAPVLHDYYDGKIMWLTFASARAYGLRLAAGAQTQLWMVAFDPAKAALGQDPSYPAFWLPFQDMTSGNHIAQWSSQVPRKSCSGTGTSTCDPGEQCVNGTCTPISSL